MNLTRLKLLATAAGFALDRRPTDRPEGEFRLSNPLELRPALVMAALFGLILAVTALAGRWLGPAGVIASAGLAGIGDVHAATLAASTLLATGTIGVRDALIALLVAFLVNMSVKLGIVGVAGGRRLLLITAPPLAAMAAAAVGAYIFLTASR